MSTSSHVHTRHNARVHACGHLGGALYGHLEVEQRPKIQLCSAKLTFSFDVFAHCTLQVSRAREQVMLLLQMQRLKAHGGGAVHGKGSLLLAKTFECLLSLYPALDHRRPMGRPAVGGFIGRFAV